MSMKLGDIDVANEIIDLRYQLIRTQMMLDHVLANNSLGGVGLDQATVDRIDNEAITTLQAKYPNMGITKK